MSSGILNIRLVLSRLSLSGLRMLQCLRGEMRQMPKKVRIANPLLVTRGPGEGGVSLFVLFYFSSPPCTFLASAESERLSRCLRHAQYSVRNSIVALGPSHCLPQSSKRTSSPSWRETVMMCSYLWRGGLDVAAGCSKKAQGVISKRGKEKNNLCLLQNQWQFHKPSYSVDNTS